MINNIIVKNSKWTPHDVNFLFPTDEPKHFTECNTIEDLMVELDIYPSKSKARQTGRVGPIASGWSEIKANKRRLTLYIWNPSE